MTFDAPQAPGRPLLAVDFVLGTPIRPRGPAYTAVRVAEAMAVPGLDVRMFGQPNLWPGKPPVPVVGRWPFPGAGLVARSPHEGVKAFLRRFTESDLMRFLDHSADGRRVVYTWSELSLRLAEGLHRRGVPVVREKINCGKAMARQILADAYASLGEGVPSSIPDAAIAKEARELELADAVFCPSPMVARSLRAIGIPETKLLPTSYGWEPGRFAGTDRALEPVDVPTFLFVGYVCVRKGAHLLLDAWQRAGRPGRLVLVGNIEPLIARRYASLLAEPSVRYMPFTPDVGAIFRSADWFVFPSLEEGGPQVTYEAAGCGIPGIVSEMGAGAFTRDGEDGVIVGTNDVDSWADALVRLGPDRDLQQRLAASARAHAADFTWERVGARRAAALLQRFG